MQKVSRTYPIDSILPNLLAAFRQSNNVVLSAPTGAGKTTRVPLALLPAEWMGHKKLLMLEPRRLAARRAAEYMAAQLGESVGETVGFRIRGDAIVSKRTQIEVVTEGILTRILQHEPELPDVALVIFDEFHERSIHADLGLALTLDVQQHLCNDLRILVMSATLDQVAVAQLLGEAEVIESSGFSYPIETRYAKFSSDKPPEVRVTETILKAVNEEEGDILVFLPGRREIRRVENLLWEKRLPEEILVHSLYGDAPYQQQSAALSPAPSGKRKVILSTSVAETSLTIDGIRVIIDSGLARTARFDVRRGMSGLITVPVSKAISDQRRGRAGRQQPGVCYRLWTETEHARLPDYPQPEIKTADLAPFAIDLAQWGTPTGEHLRFLDPPQATHLTQAQALLKNLGALDRFNKLSEHGRAMAELPVHPRLSHMILQGKELGFGAQACNIAALLEERDVLAGRGDTDIDLASRLHVLQQKQNSDVEYIHRVLSQARRLRQLANVHENQKKEDENVLGLLLALAYPERIASRREQGGYTYQTVSGTTVVLPKGSLLTREEFLAIGEVDGVGAEVRAFLAAPIARKSLQEVFADSMSEEEDIQWSPKDESVIARIISRIGAVIITEQRLEPRGEKVKMALLDGIRQMGLECLPWNKESRALQKRSEWLRRHLNPTDWPDLSDASLIKRLDDWLLPFLDTIWRRDQLKNLKLIDILQSQFTGSQWQELERLAPSHLKLPSGSHIVIDYSTSDQPVLAVKLQELFGQRETPRIADGKVNVLLHLLSPASRPLAVTQDLGSFWKTVYPEIRTHMHRRYPKHFWPEDPLTAKPTNKTIKKKK